MTNRLTAYGVAALVGFVLALALFGRSAKERERVHERVVVRTRVDTVHDVLRVPFKPIVASGRSSHSMFMKNKRCTVLDTLLRTDTTAISPDTLHIAYCPPEDRFDLDLRFSPRRIPIAIPVTLHDTLTEHDTTLRDDQSLPWYEEALMLLGAAAAGYVMGRTTP